MTYLVTNILVSLPFSPSGLLILGLLQVFLSCRRRWWPGVILPVYTFICALFMVAVIWRGTGPLWLLAANVLLYNIPTCVLLAIYFICRRLRRKKQLDKMKIQDL